MCRNFYIDLNQMPRLGVRIMVEWLGGWRWRDSWVVLGRENAGQQSCVILSGKERSQSQVLLLLFTSDYNSVFVTWLMWFVFQLICFQSVTYVKAIKE